MCCLVCGTLRDQSIEVHFLKELNQVYNQALSGVVLLDRAFLEDLLQIPNLVQAVIDEGILSVLLQHLPDHLELLLVVLLVLTLCLTSLVLVCVLSSIGLSVLLGRLLKLWCSACQLLLLDASLLHLLGEAFRSGAD